MVFYIPLQGTGSPSVFLQLLNYVVVKRMSLYTLDKHSDESLYNKIKNGVLELTSYFESMHNSGDILSADRAFCQLTATLDTCEHVPTLQQHTVNRSIHTHFAQEVTLNSWEWGERGDITYTPVTCTKEMRSSPLVLRSCLYHATYHCLPSQQFLPP